MSNLAEFDERYFPGMSTSPIDWPLPPQSDEAHLEPVDQVGDDSVEVAPLPPNAPNRPKSPSTTPSLPDSPLPPSSPPSSPPYSPKDPPAFVSFNDRVCVANFEAVHTVYAL